MIPLRILLKGFLCYRDEQEVLLDGSSLWMMAGLNGSGKSAIFDAMTFALFGAHRGGKQDQGELINHDSDRLYVEFDFGLDRQTYRIKRTVQRSAQGSPKTTQQIFRLTPAEAPGGTGRPEAVPDTSKKNEFNAWIEDHIGLSYETFTSSVLLLQGKAERLLDSGASDRFKVLSSIVDLERYRRLHERADTRRKVLRDHVEILVHQLEGLPTVTGEELATLDAKIAQAGAEREQAQSELERLQELERQARQWSDLQMKRTSLEERWKQAQGTLDKAEAIQKDLRRLNELKDVIPLLKTAVERRLKVRESQKKTDQLTTQDQTLTEKLAEVEHAIEQTRKKQERLRKQLTTDEQQHRDVNKQLRDLSTVLERVKLCEQQRETLTRQEKELAAFPLDLGDRLTRLRQENERLSELERVLPLLARLHGQRDALRSTREQEQAFARLDKEVRDKGDQLKKQQATLQKAVVDAEGERQQADEKATEARTLQQQAQAQLKDFLNLEGAQICRQCGQPLTKGHFEEEKRRREKALAEAKSYFQQTERTQKAKQQQEAHSRQELAACEAKLVEARDEFRTCKIQIEQARRDIERLSSECGQAFADLPPAFRERVTEPGANGAAVDWPAISFPTEADLAGLREQKSGLDAARKGLREAETQQGRWEKLKALRDQTRQTLSSLEAELPQDVGAIRRKHLRLESTELTLAANIKAAREEQQASHEEVDRLGKERASLQQKKAETTGKLSTEESQRKMCLEEVERIRQKLPPEWQKHADTAEMKVIFDWEGEKSRLVQADTEGRAKQLQQTILQLESLRLSRDEVSAECERFPAEARLRPEEVQARLESTRKVQAACDRSLQEAQRTRAVLDSQRQQREQVQKQLLEQQAEHQRYNLLAQLLGRERLQRHLVRQAEKQVVDHANAVLDRLSGGRLYLRLRGGDDGDTAAEKALELEAYDRSTGQAPESVAFLSGSQRFRVAVALALGLGQYASRQHRPIESVIIDEGFGCLDRQGRQVMIQELQNLRGQLRCILLVSHQEEFADAFSDGYLFELADGSTRIKRFQR
ncbi:MAG: SMC family ATPase [Planctomycetes bacterium]|nr:SMC family ATPase [Planctomycetota bacterium]